MFSKMLRMGAMLVGTVTVVASQAAITWSTIADSAVNVMSSAVSGCGPAIVGIVGLIVGIGIVIRLLHKAGR